MNKKEHLLTCLSEECAEVIQAVSKALRFGLDDIEPGEVFNNAAQIVKEYADIMAVFELLADDLENANIVGLTPDSLIEAKKAKVKIWMEHAVKVGTLQPD